MSIIIVSCRKDFESDQKFSKELAVREYDKPTDTKSFRTLDLDELGSLVDGKHAAIFVHGFRNPLGNVLSAYDAVQRELKTKELLDASDEHAVANYGRVIGFAWPGFRTRAFGFFAARPSANRSGEFLRMLIEQLRRSARSIDIQTHSLGARVALQAMASTSDLWVDNLMLTAPAVDDECLEPNEEFNEALDSCGRVFVYHSKEDSALKAYVIGSVDRALGSKGPQHPKVVQEKCPNVYVIDCTAVVKKDHSGYRKTPKYFAHWAKILNQEPLPRFSTL